jgi:hypothetical protein
MTITSWVTTQSSIIITIIIINSLLIILLHIFHKAMRRDFQIPVKAQVMQLHAHKHHSGPTVKCKLKGTPENSKPLR